MIKNLPALSDLSVRAVHLDLIVKMLPNMIDREVPITRPNLYQTYIARELSRETIHNKRLRLISDEDRLALMRIVAAERFFESYDDLNFEVAARIVQRELGLSKPEVEPVTRDFLNRSFLHREGDTYRFAHKSLGEYLFALELHDRIIKGDLAFFEKTIISSAVAGMVLDLFGGLEAFNQMLIALMLNPDRFRIEDTEITRVNFAAMGLADYTHGILSISREERLRGGEFKRSTKTFLWVDS
jgi:hypothetical protein